MQVIRTKTSIIKIDNPVCSLKPANYVCDNCRCCWTCSCDYLLLLLLLFTIHEGILLFSGQFPVKPIYGWVVHMYQAKSFKDCLHSPVDAQEGPHCK